MTIDHEWVRAYAFGLLGEDGRFHVVRLGGRAATYMYVLDPGFPTRDEADEFIIDLEDDSNTYTVVYGDTLTLEPGE